MLHFAWVLDGIPEDSAAQRNSKDTTNAREKGQHAIIFHQQGGICIAVSVRFPLAAFQLPASCACAPVPVRAPASQARDSSASHPPFRPHFQVVYAVMHKTAAAARLLLALWWAVTVVAY